MADSASTQPTIQEQVDQKLRAQQVHAIAQTQSEITPLSKEQEPAFRAWVAAHNIRDLDVPDSHYDYRGAFLAHVEPDAAGHWPDTFKQHGHPTFTTESQYSMGPQDGGTWAGDTFVPAQPSTSTQPVSPVHPAIDALRQLREDPTNRTAVTAIGNVSTQNQAAIRALLDLHGDTPSLTTADSQAMMQQHPNFPIHFPEEPHIGPLGNILEQAAIQARDAAVGLVNATLGSASAPVPVVSEEEARRIRLTTGTPGPWGTRIGQQLVQTEREIEQHQTAAAFVGSSLVGGAASITILRGLAGIGVKTGTGSMGALVKTALSNTAMGAAFGAMRPKYQGESLLGAIATDMIVFGGLGLAGGLVGKLTTPIQVGVDALEKAGIVIDPKVMHGAEYGKALFEQIQEVSNGLDAKGLTPTPNVPFGSLIDVTQAVTPDNIGFIRRWLGSPSHFDKQLKWFGLLGATERGDVVGDVFQRVVTNFRGRQAIATQVRGEWEAILTEAHDLITRDIPPMGGGFTETTKMALMEQRELALGELLDNVFHPTALPPNTPPGMAQAHGIIRDRLLADRELLRLQRGGVADWGIDAYLPHVNVKEYAIITKGGASDAASYQVFALTNIKDLRATAMKVVADNPGVPIEIIPSKFIHHAELSGIGLSGQALARFISGASRALSVDRDEIASMLFENRIAKVKPSKRFFKHAQRRGEVPLEGWEANPFEALRTYAVGLSRAAAFYDGEQKVAPIIAALEKVPGAETAVSALKAYVSNVLGHAGPEEFALRMWVKDMAKRTAARTHLPGVQQFAEDYGDPAVGFGKLASWEANARLGYNPMAAFVNLTQTLTNTASAIGWGPTMRAVRLFLDKSQRPQVDALLKAMDINLAIPLTMADQITIRNIGQVSPWHPLYLYNKIEVGNRALAGLAKYQEVILKGGGIRDALDEARTFIKDTQKDYSVADSPRLLQGPLGASMFQFKKYYLFQQEFFLQLPPAGKARFLAAYWALGGVTALMSLPPLLLLDWASGELTGEKISERLQAKYPRASRGLPGLAGIDLGGNIAIGTPGGFGPSDAVGPGIIDLFRLAHGVAQESKPIFDLIQGKQGYLTPVDRGNTVAQLVPTVARRLYDAYDILTAETVRARSTHEIQFTPDNVEREAVLTAFGFRSLQRSENQRVYTTNKRRERLQAEHSAAAIQAWVTAYTDGEFDRASQILQDAIDNKLDVNSEALGRALSKTMLDRNLRGVRQAPRSLKVEELERLRQLERP